MLSRSFARTRPLHTSHLRYFSVGSNPVGYSAYQQRVGELQKQYPGLYKDAQSFSADQKQVLDACFSNLSKSVDEYNQARAKVADLCGEDVFMTLSAEELQQNVSMVAMQERSSQEIQRQFEVGNQYIQQLIGLQDMKGLNDSAKTLRMIEIQDVLSDLDYWKARLLDDIDDPGDFGLPIPDSEMDSIIRDAYYHAPSDVKAAPHGMSEEEHQKLEDAWLSTLDDHLAEEIGKRVDSFDKKRFKEYSATLNELFHPRDIDHYPLNDYAKSFVRATFWQGKERFNSVVESMNQLENLLQVGGERSAEMLRGAYEARSDMKNKSIAAMQLRLSDPLFTARMARDIRSTLDAKAFDLSVSDAMRDLEMPLLEQEKKELEFELTKGESQVVRTKLEHVAEAQARYSRKMDSVDDVLDAILPQKMMGGDLGPVKQAFKQYASGKGSLADVNKAFDGVVQGGANAEVMDETEIMVLAVACHNAKTADYGTWNFGELLNQSRFTTSEEEILGFRRTVKQLMSAQGLDPLVINLLRVLIEDKAMAILPSVLEDFRFLAKKYLGEVEATVSVAENVSDDEFNQIVAALQKANPEKKFTVEKRVEPALLGGFIVKAGVQTFDFSLTTQITSTRRQMNV